MASQQGLHSQALPTEANAFLRYIGGIPHPRDIDKKTGKHKRIMKWAPYQAKLINEPSKSIVVLKNNKGGGTLALLVRDFIMLMRPEYAGGRVLFILPVEKLGIGILGEFKHILRESNISDYYIAKPTPEMMLNEKSNAHMLYIKNPYDPARPSRIMVMGVSEQLAFSWPDIVGIHMSDPGQIKAIEQENFFNGLYTRLAISEGFFVMEGPCGKTKRGHFWKVCKHVFKLDSSTEELEDEDAVSLGGGIQDEETHIMAYKGFMFTIEDSVKAGVITKAKQAEFMRLPPDDYARLFMCVWPAGGGMAFTHFVENTDVEAVTL